MKPSRPSKGYYGKAPVKAEQGTGGLQYVTVAMQLPHIDPCVECPLRIDAQPGYLGGYTPEMYIEALEGPASIACHNSPGFHTGEVGKQRQCTGVCGYRANIHLELPDHFVSAIQGIQAIGMDDRFFVTAADFIAHHKDAQNAED
jgi:hypothetical protein